MRYLLAIPIIVVLPFCVLSLIVGFFYQMLYGFFFLGRRYPLYYRKTIKRDKTPDFKVVG